MPRISEVSSKSHECSACGGRGEVCAYDNTVGPVGLCRHRAYRCDTDCPVCLGSGRIVDDSTSRRDAVADAETLRQNMLYGSIFDATYPLRGWFSERDVKRHAYISARAAFRAVPGLRGE